MSGILRGFGMMFDLVRGSMRRWVVGADGVKRWADNDQPVSEGLTVPTARPSTADLLNLMVEQDDQWCTCGAIHDRDEIGQPCKTCGKRAD